MTDTNQTAGTAESGKASTTIAGFELLQRVGRGGMGTVYKARQLSVDRIVALKILKPNLAQNRAFIQRFQEEARAAAKLNHPHVVQAIDCGEEGGYYYFAMEYIDGETLHRVMLREGILDERKALRLAIEVARALGHANAHGIVHRDIKPGNIMVSRDGVTKLCDLGLARLGDDDSGGRGQAIGTPYYISPEQATGKLDVDTRSDIYSLGATLYRALAGRPAFDAPTPAEILEKHVRAPLPWPKDHNPALSDSVCYVIAKMMAKKPEERYQTPEEVIEDIERVLRGEAPRSSVVQLEIPPVRMGEAERALSAMTTTRIREKRRGIRALAQVRERVDKVSKEQSIPPHTVVQLLRQNLDEGNPETFLKYGLILLSLGRREYFRLARKEFAEAARHGADVSAYMAKLDALGPPAGMAYIPAGEFIAGPPDAQQAVDLPAFYIDANLVTNREYALFLRAVPTMQPPGHWIGREMPEGAGDLPVVNILWDEARAYAEWKGKRLPTSAEWQKAARGADARRYPWGDEFDPRRCNTSESGINELTVAGRYPRGASPYGCLDMIGNVVQWCADEGPANPEEPDGRAICGVSWEEAGAPAGCWRVESRKRVRRSRKCGFRCALSL